ncbi:MAG: hypothetical protein ACE5OZ_20865 [Candidatus Heimdallarchaeota archaeon]
MSSEINEILEAAFEAAKEVRNSEKTNAKGKDWAKCSESHLKTMLFDEIAAFCTSECPQELLDVMSAAALLFIRMTGRSVTNYSVAVRVSNALKEEIEILISDKRLGFGNVMEFVNDALRNRIDYYRDAQLMRKQRERVTIGI